MVKKIVIVPGNGCVDVVNSNWYAEFASAAEAAFPGYKIVLRNMPDPYVAKESVWIPFLKDDVEVGEDTVVVGHSSGAVCAMRLLETTKLKGVVLVATCHTDLGDENEKASGYFDRAWQWDEIKKNAGFITQYHSADDHLIPVEEARHVAGQLQGDAHEYIEMENHSHFFTLFPELLENLKKRLL
jgi:predicted alpha/beta hydrolase family esterase